MAEHESPIETYSLNVNSPDSERGRVIHLRGRFGMAFVHLVPASEELPANRKAEDSDQFYVYLSRDAWAPLVDMLRHESPVNFYFSDETGAAGIYTDREIVGEGEE